MKNMRVTAWYAIFGLLPLWASLVLVIAGSFGRSSDYWLAAPWLILLAIPLCAITLVMAGAAHAAYVRTPGGTAPKIRRSVLWLAGLSGLVLLGIAVHWRKEVRLKADQEAGRVLVERSALMTRAAPGGFGVFLHVTRFTRSGVADRFDYHVSASGSGKSHMAIVETTRGEGDAGLRLACVIPTDDYHHLESGNDPCRSSHAVVP